MKILNGSLLIIGILIMLISLIPLLSGEFYGFVILAFGVYHVAEFVRNCIIIKRLK